MNIATDDRYRICCVVYSEAGALKQDLTMFSPRGGNIVLSVQMRKLRLRVGTSLAWGPTDSYNNGSFQVLSAYGTPGISPIFLWL